MKVVCSGGLGNQMFQYALYLTLIESGKNVKLDSSLYSLVQMHNGFELDRCFNIHAQQVKPYIWNSIRLRLILKFKPQKLLYQEKSNYDKDVLNTKCAFISGYWQTEKYFRNIENKIREAFVFKNIDSTNLELAKKISNNSSIAVHIRRGDYIQNGAHSKIYSGICTEVYYKRAIELIMSRIVTKKKILAYIFSDDKYFADQFIKKLDITAEVIDINKGIDSYKDMYLMSQCDHNIIANSSFSWWGAWLNRNPNKIVIAPEQWFKSTPTENYCNIIPDTWIKL